MRGAARDIDSGGQVAELFHGVPVPPGSVPSLRLLAALHHLVLSDAAPALAEEWLPGALAHGADGDLTVLWQSVVRQYLEPRQWESIERAFDHAVRARDESRPLVWLRMEPSDDHLANYELSLRTHSEPPSIQLARCGDHGPPIAWQRPAWRPA